MTLLCVHIGLSLLAAAEAVGTPDDAQPVSAQAVLARIAEFDPRLLRARAEVAAAQVALHRARWRRVSGALGVRAQHAAYQGGLMPSEPIDASGRRSTDRFSANLGAELAVPLFAGGALNADIEAASLGAQASQEELAALRFELEHDALALYAGLIAALEQGAIAARAVERANLVVGLAQRRAEAGVGTDADVARAELNLLSQRELAADASGSQRELEAQLAAALSYAPGTRLRVSEELDALAELGSKHQETLAELRALEARRGEAAAQEARAVAQYWPRLELFGEANYGNGTAYLFNGVPVNIGTSAERFGVFAGSWAAGLRASWTAFDFFATQDAVASAQAATQAASARLLDQVRNAGREVAVAQAREEVAEARLAALAGGTSAAERAVRLTRARYESGGAIISDVLAAELDAIRIESRLVDARHARVLGRLERLRAEGRAFGGDR